MEKKVRERYLDIVKVAGSIAIVALHTLSNTVNAGGGYISEARYTIVNVLHQFLYLAVPVFVLATGAGFLSDGQKISYGRMKKHIIKTVFCIILFGFLFALVKGLAGEGDMNPGNLILAVLTDNTWSHMWYLYRLLGVYLCMPMLSAFMNNTDGKDQIIFAGVILFFGCLYLYIAGPIGFIPAQVMPLSGIWFFYLIAGGILGREAERLQKYRFLFWGGAVLGAAVMFWKGLQGSWLNEEYPFGLLLAVSVFALIRIYCAGKCSPPWLAKLAQTALGVYIIHPVFIHICVRLLQFNPQFHMPLLTLPLMILIVYACAVAVVGGLRRIPPIRKYIL